MLPFVLAVGLAVAAAWWSWRGRLGAPIARWGMLARAAALFALLLLLIDPGVATRRIDRRPLVLLDNSISMHAAQGRAGDATRAAAALGDTVSFGELAPGEPGGRSNLFDPLSGALAGGRSVTVVTDGEIPDVTAIPAELLTQASVRLFTRAVQPDIALTEVRAPARLAAGDTLTVDIEAQRSPGTADSANVVVRDSTTVLARGMLKFGASTRAHLQLRGALPRSTLGERWLRVERVGAADGETDDDVRWLHLAVTATPGIVVIADAPDWDSRALYRTLKDVVAVPVRGYAQLQRGQWRRMDDLRPVAAAEVVAAARGANLLAVRGDPAAWRSLGRSRLLWPTATQPGDWYVAGGGLSPVSSAFAGVDADSLPPAPGIFQLDSLASRSWVGASARLSRRGLPVPIIGGRDDHTGRTVTIGIDGLYRWAQRGGAADQVWRATIADAATWLLAAPESDSVRARVTTPVTQRGRPVHFRWVAAGTPLPIAIVLHGPGRERDDTLRFDGTGDASIALPVGRYQYALDKGGSGNFAVEPYSDEIVAAPVTLSEHVGSAAASSPRRSLRELVWLFAIAVVGFGTEWLLRRRLGLR